MISRTQKRGFDRFILAAVAVLFLMAGSADAHMFVLKADKMKAGKGEFVTVWAGLAEPLIAMDMSRAMLLSMGYDVYETADVQYADGHETSLPGTGFKPTNVNDPANVDPLKATAEVDRFQVVAEGTAVLHGKFVMTNKEGKKTVCFAKTFVNLTNDGMATKRYAGDDVAEVLFRKNTDGYKKGDKVAVQVLLRGKPLANADVSATYDGAPAQKPGSPQNEYLTLKTNARGEAEFMLDRAALWAVTIEYSDQADGIRYRSSALFEVE